MSALRTASDIDLCEPRIAARPSGSGIRWLVLFAFAMLFGVAAAPNPVAEGEKREIADAVIGAYRLETEYWRDPRRFGTWESLYAHYRRGFSADIAEQMTEFTLDNDGDMATWVPREVFVVDHDDAFALAWFRTPKDFTDGPWAFQPYMVVRLRREDDHWVVYWATDSATPPTTPPPSP